MTETLADPRAARLELLRRRRAAHSAKSTAHSAETTAHSAETTAHSAGATAGLGTAERRMWRIHRLDQDSVSHNITLLLDVTGTTAERLVAGIETTVAGAEVLGSVIVDDDGSPRREPRPPVGRWVEPGGLWALGGGPIGEGISPADAATALARTPFDLTREAPVRARVYRDGTSTTAVLSFHHLAVDDTSWPVLLGAVLAGEWVRSTDAPAPDHLDGARLAAAVDHARSTWAAPDVRFPLSGQLPATTPEQSWLNPIDEGPGQQQRHDLDVDDLNAFTAYAPSVGGTGNAALLALTAVAVTALTGATDHVLLVPADNRRPGHAPDRVGYCGNIVPIRFTFDTGATVADAMRSAITAIYTAMEYVDVDFGPILTALRGSGGRFPVVEIMASVRNAPMRGVDVPAGMRVDYRSVSTGIAPYPLTLAVELAADGGAHLEVDHQLGTGEVIVDRAAPVVATLLHRIPTAADQPLSVLLASATATPDNPDEAA
ncbi:peptide synthetase [Gordonia sp. (in: high G+C Gram-positive bacteria)]|uniref:peptide synthetase n=1 Tax=Gordonia sp. (in: high G+C Gram-positive bacteria) TaxID=84139 RepID=UPI0039E3807A